MDRNEKLLKNFICEKIEKAGGSSQIKYLSQLLSSLNYDVRSSVANNQGELMRFLRKYSEIFQVDANGNVRLQNQSSSQADEDQPKKRFEKSEQSDDLPRQLKNAEGVVIKINPTFGFIAAKSPFKTTVYFSPNTFSDEQVTLLTDIDRLHLGVKVGFHASKASNSSRSSQYRAFKVWLLKSEKEDNKNKFPNNNCEPNSRKTRETGKYDGTTNEGEGKIVKLTSAYGFIEIDDDKNNTVFFYKKQLVKYENVVDLNKVLKVGDLVEFKAVRTGQKNIKARWSATQVWVKKSDKSKPNSKDNAPFEKGARKKQYLQNQVGKIYPHSKGIVIKFGPKNEDIADADSSMFYLLGTKVSDVSWEFSDGDTVHFDAVEIKSHPGWKATLVWTGKRPNVVMAPDLGDFSEFGDDIDDDASTVSKVSDLSDNSYRSYQPAPSRSSGYSSMRQSQEDLHFRIPPSIISHSDTHSYADMDVEDISDTTSVYSRSSDKSSGGPGRGSTRSSRAQGRRGANFKKFSNRDNRQYNGHNGFSSYKDDWEENENRNFNSNKEKRQESLSSNHYNERRVNNNFKESNSYRERRQGSVNRNSNSYRGRKEDKKKRSSSVGKRSSSDIERFKRHEKLLSKYIEDSPDEAIDDNNSTISGSSKDDATCNKADEPETKKYINWADTPYPGEDSDLEVNYGAEKDVLETEKVILETEKAETRDSANELSDDMPVEEEADVYNSDDEFSDAVEEREDSLPLNDRNLLATNDDLSSDAKEEKEVPLCSVKIFKEIEGEIKSVRCRYGQIVCPLLPMAANFFWQDVYYNKLLVSDQYEDLREVVKAGDLLKFNCISVVDDEGQNFIKCTLLWKGKKPNINEMTPQQFINEENLQVSLSEEDYKIEVSTTEVPSNKPKRKFLVTVNDNLEQDDDGVSASVTEPLPNSSVPNEVLVSDLSLPNSSVRNKVQVSDFSLPSTSVLEEVLLDELSSEMSDTEAHSDKEELIEGISKIIKFGGLPVNSEIDLSTVSTEILNYITNMYSAKKIEIVNQSAKETQTDFGDDVPKPEPKFRRSDDTVYTSTESQTIFTGQVIGNNIFTDL